MTEGIIQGHFGMSRLELELVICARGFHLRHNNSTGWMTLEFKCLENVFVCIGFVCIGVDKIIHRSLLTVSRISAGQNRVWGTEIFYYPLVKSDFRHKFCRLAQCTLEL